MRIGLHVSAALCALDLLITPARAIVDGQSMDNGKSAEDQLVRERAVRLVVREEDASYRVFCSGTLLDPTTVISAAHCFGATMVEPVAKGLIFAERTEANGQVARRKLNLSAAEFSSRMDLSLAQTDAPYALTLKLPRANAPCDANARHSVVGLGVNESGQFASTPRLAHYGDRSVGGPLWFRLLQHDGYVCEGDSGGAVLCPVGGHLALAGVLSSGRLEGSPTASEGETLADACRRGRTLGVTSISALPELIGPAKSAGVSTPKKTRPR